MLKSFRILALCAAVAVSGCSSIPISSLYQLSRIDFMTTELSAFRFALNLPLVVRPRPGGVQMDLAYTQGENAEQKRVVHLDESISPADFVGLPQAPAGTKTYVYKLPSKEVATLNKIRSDAILAKAKNQKGSLSMGVAAKEFCATAPILKGPLLLTTFVLSSENNDYVVLTRDIDIRSDATVAASLENLKLCSN